ncbi:MAG: carboxypeptidase regulatory-like domain-containing protein [Desulfobacterales bacterium]|nr:carboxypeptidase regulatory-like domain-containing protein [Desulfobacterales bacterium]
MVKTLAKWFCCNILVMFLFFNGICVQLIKTAWAEENYSATIWITVLDEYGNPVSDAEVTSAFFKAVYDTETKRYVLEIYWTATFADEQQVTISVTANKSGYLPVTYKDIVLTSNDSQRSITLQFRAPVVSERVVPFWVEKNRNMVVAMWTYETNEIRGSLSWSSEANVNQLSSCEDSILFSKAGSDVAYRVKIVDVNQWLTQTCLETVKAGQGWLRIQSQGLMDAYVLFAYGLDFFLLPSITTDGFSSSWFAIAEKNSVLSTWNHSPFYIPYSSNLCTSNCEFLPKKITRISLNEMDNAYIQATTDMIQQPSFTVMVEPERADMMPYYPYPISNHHTVPIFVNWMPYYDTSYTICAPENTWQQDGKVTVSFKGIDGRDIARDRWFLRKGECIDANLTNLLIPNMDNFGWIEIESEEITNQLSLLTQLIDVDNDRKAVIPNFLNEEGNAWLWPVLYENDPYNSILVFLNPSEETVTVQLQGGYLVNTSSDEYISYASSMKYSEVVIPAKQMQFFFLKDIFAKGGLFWIQATTATMKPFIAVSAFYNATTGNISINKGNRLN